jgi:colicin import membrane protein
VFSWREFGAQLRAFGFAIGIHALMAALVVLGTMNWQPFRKQQNLGLTIEAVIVDTSQIKKQREEARKAVEREELRQKRADQLKQQQKREQEQKRELELKAEQRRQEQLEVQQKREAQDRLQKLRIERERKLEAERLKQQQELEDIRKQRQAADKQRKLEAERLKQLEARKETENLEQRRMQEEAARQRQADAEAAAFKSGQLATERDKYVMAIAAVVTQNWLRPPTARAGLSCTVHVVQIPGGEVISSNIVGRCNGDEATRRSIIAAVERTGILPYRGFEDVFEREINFNFSYDGE